MVQRAQVILTDDLTGEEADETLHFAFDGKAYAIDLTTKNAEKFRKLIAPYATAARREGSVPKQKARTHTTTGVDASAVRAWAASNGYPVSSRGRVSAELVAAYRAAGN